MHGFQYLSVYYEKWVPRLFSGFGLVRLVVKKGKSRVHTAPSNKIILDFSSTRVRPRAHPLQKTHPSVFFSGKMPISRKCHCSFLSHILIYIYIHQSNFLGTMALTHLEPIWTGTLGFGTLNESLFSTPKSIPVVRSRRITSNEAGLVK